MPYRPDIDEKLCFVIMPFNPPFNDYYHKYIRPFVESMGLIAKRGDEIYVPSPVITSVWNDIWRSRFVIADMTDRNPNVNYELGLCHAIGVPTILITQKMADVPFDTSHIRCIVYDTKSATWVDDLRAALRKAIEAILTAPEMEPVLTWPYSALGVEAGIGLFNSRYRYTKAATAGLESAGFP